MGTCIGNFSIRKETRGSLLANQPDPADVGQGSEGSYSKGGRHFWGWQLVLPSGPRLHKCKGKGTIGCRETPPLLTFIVGFCYIVLFSYWFLNFPLCALDKVYPGSVCIRENICIGFNATCSLKFPQKHPLWMKGGCSTTYRYCIPKKTIEH